MSPLSGIRWFPLLCAAAAIALLAAGGVRVTAQGGSPHATDALPDRIEFNRDIRPILSDKCFKCHGNGTQFAGLRLDLEAPAKTPLKSGRIAVVAGNPAASQLMARVTAASPAVRMPRGVGGLQGEPLSAREIDLLTRWIEQGAQWQKHWSFIPPTAPALPDVRTPAWVRNPIDAFVLQRLEREGLAPSREADPATLLRRVSLDLTGLPPTLAELDRFLGDRSSNAYEKVVDRLLQSPRYGERMAYPWLDAARYADSNGYQMDGERYMWRWRDWVIDAFNANKRYDQFLLEQIAGDLLPNATMEQKMATGFNRNHRGNSEGGIIPEEYQAEYLFDRVDTVGTAVLGLSFGCTKCHSHKYDPISHKEYYQLTAYFNNIPEHGKFRRVGNSPPVMEAPTPDQLPRIKRLADDVAAATNAWMALQPQLAREQRLWERSLGGAKPLVGGPRRGLVAHYPFDGDLRAAVFVEAPRANRPAARPRPPADAQSIPEDAAPATRGARSAPAPTLAPGVFGQAASFDGASLVQNDADLIGFRVHGTGRDAGGDNASEPTVTYDEPFTFAAWIHPNGPTGAIVTRDDDIVEPNGYGLKLNKGKLAFDYVTKWADESIQVETERALSLNEWHHVAVTYGGSRWADSVTLYVDGQRWALKVLFDDGNGQGAPRRQPLRIGAGGGPGNRFRGLIDEVRVYDRALSADEAAMLATKSPVDEIVTLPEAQRSPAQAALVREAFLDHGASARITRARASLFETEQRQFTFHKNEVPTVMVMQELPTPRTTHLLQRGLYDKPGELVTPAIPAIFAADQSRYEPNRLGLAKWIIDSTNPLTARVAVNRFWQQYFGVGLVRTSEDFGSQGEPPSHPELLDWLAAEFMRTGWNVKALHKTIVMSATYRQASNATDALIERDPRNRLLARGPNVRLPAEMVRDQALAASGLLFERVGGPSVRPYQPEGLWSEIIRGAVYTQSHGSDLYRRSIYTFVRRAVPPPSLATFDASARESCVVRPAATNTPLQALDLMNNMTYLEAARVLAERMITEGGAAPDARLAYGFRRVTLQQPTANQRSVLLDALAFSVDSFRARPADAATFVAATGEAPRDRRVDATELAAYTNVASLMLNMNQAVMKD